MLKECFLPVWISVHKHSAGVGAGAARTQISYFRRTNTQRHSEKIFFNKDSEEILKFFLKFLKNF